MSLELLQHYHYLPHATQNVNNWMPEYSCSWKMFPLPKREGKAVPVPVFEPGRPVTAAGATEKNTLGKNSFSLLQQLPHTEEAAGAEAGSQRKVNSKINELGKGNREVEKKKQPRNYVSNLPRCARGGKNRLSRKGSENKGRPKLGEH